MVKWYMEAHKDHNEELGLVSQPVHTVATEAKSSFSFFLLKPANVGQPTKHPYT